MPKKKNTVIANSLPAEGYTLEQVVVLSRHSIRAPLSSGSSILGIITPHQWYKWSSNPSGLSLRGGILETEMGQYFRVWLEDEGLFPQDFRPTDGSVRIYANGRQRTIATANYFVSGLLPAWDATIETHVDFDTMDPTFEPKLTFVSPAYVEAAEKQIRDTFTPAIESLADNYKLLADVIDLKDSQAYKDGTVTEFRTDDSEFVLVLDDEPRMKGSLKTACSVSDALVLQYYEESDHKKAAFGHRLTERQWRDIAEIKEMHLQVMFSTPLVAANVANPLLKEIQSELTTPGRKFTFLCGHDSNIASVLAALGAEPYELPHAIDKTPIGGKIVFARWRAEDGSAWISVDLVHQTTEQLQEASLLDLDINPASADMHFKGLTAHEAALYEEAAFMARLRDAIAQYDQMVETYKAE